MEYDRAARKRLGRAIRAARTNAGYPNRADFADRMKRSTRQVQALENGEDGVGPDTWAAAAAALEWDLERVYAILGGDEPSDRSASTALASASVEDLAAEVLRRMKAGDGDDRDAAAIVVPSIPRAKVDLVKHGLEMADVIEFQPFWDRLNAEAARLSLRPDEVREAVQNAVDAVADEGLHEPISARPSTE